MYFFHKTDRDCVPFLHFYHAKIVNIDILLLWRSVSCTKAFNVTKIHIRILMNRFVQSYYTQRDRLFLITPVLKLIMSTIYKRKHTKSKHTVDNIVHVQIEQNFTRLHMINISFVHVRLGLY